MATRLHGTIGTWTLPEGETVMGRAEGCAIRIPDRRLSRRHAAFQVAEGVAMIVDLGSANPVLINGDRLVGRTVLTHGDAIVIGPFLLRVEITAGAPPVRLSTTFATQDSAAPPAPAPLPRGATQAMDPAEVASLAEDSRQAKAVDPDIAAAIGRPPTRRMPLAPSTAAHRHDTTKHRPATWQADPTGSALDASRPALATAVDGQGPTTGFVAPDQSQPATSALTAGPQRRSWFRPLVLRRLTAIALDLGSLVAVGTVVGLVPLVVGLTKACLMQGAAVVDGRVVLGGTAAPAGFHEVLLALLSPTGMAEVPRLVHHLLTEARSFPALFLGLSGAAIALELVLLFGTVVATVRRGAPFWHRHLGLEVVVRRNGHRPGWLAALLRWTLLPLLAPVTLVTVWWAGRSWHDRLAGLEVRERRSR